MKKIIRYPLFALILMVSVMLSACGGFNVKFETNGGTPVATISVNKDNAQTEIEKAINKVSKTHYDLAGIYFDASKTNEWSTNSVIDKEITLYFDWKAKTYILTLDANGGFGEMSPMSIKYLESTNITTNTYTRIGYEFSGWNEKADGTGVVYAQSASYTMQTANPTIYAQWLANKYNVTFNANGGTGEMSNLSMDFGSSKALTTNTFTRDGYVFAGWNTIQTPTEANLGKSFADGETYTMNNIVGGVATGVTLYAQWAEISYNVIFNSNGGTGTMDNLAINYSNSKNLTANTFTKTGYKYTGWNTKADGTGTSYADNIAFLMNNIGDVTLYAQWTAKSYNVIFDANGGTGSMQNQVYTFDSHKPLSACTLSRMGYTFTGWNTKADGTGTTYLDQADFTMSYEGGISLFAQWSINSYNIVFNANGGTGIMENQSFDFNSTKNISENLFTKEHYDFNGWNTKSNGSGSLYANKSSFTMNVLGLTLYAQWKAKEYTLTYNANFGETPATKTQQFTYNIAENLDSNTFERDGYTFVGWNTQADGQGNGYTNTSSYTMLNAGTTLYAQWTAIEYGIIFYANGGTGIMTEQKIAFDSIAEIKNNTFAKFGYVFKEWNTQANGEGVSYSNKANFTMNVKGITLYAQWDFGTYNLQFNANNGTGEMASQPLQFNTSAIINENAYTREFYTFAGWNTKTDGTGDSYCTNATNITYLMNSEGAILYAQWTANSYDLTFNANFGEIPETATQEFTYNEVEALNNNTFERTGYTFSSWNSTSDGTGTTYANQVTYTMTTAGATLYAQWTAKNYNVMFDGNGSTSGAMNSQSIAYDAQANLLINAFVKTGNLFAGWNTEADGTGTAYANNASFTMNVEGITLYAQWTANSFNVVFDANNGIGTMVPQEIGFGESENLNANTFTREFYVFDGWTTNANGSGYSYADGVSYTMTTEGITLYAKWNPNHYDLTFNANFGVEPATQTQELTYNMPTILTGNAFVRDGYTFASWNTKADGTGTTYLNQVTYTMTTAGATLYAQWTANLYGIVFNANTGEGEMANQEIAYNGSENLVSNIFTKTGYAFDSWNTLANGEGTSYIDGAEFTMSTKGTTLYAQWVVENYSFEIYNTENEKIATLTVTYNTAFTSSADYSTYETVISTLINNVPDGKTFGGFYQHDADNNNIGTKFMLNTIVGDMGENNQTIRVYISWAVQTSTVTFNYNGATAGNETSSINVTYGTAVGTLPEPTKENCKFFGWFTTQNSTNENEKVTSTTLWNDNFTTLYALFISTNDSWTIQYSVGVNAQSDETPTTSYNLSEENIVIPDYTKLGYTFSHWKVGSYPSFIGGVWINEPYTFPKDSVSNKYYIPANTAYGITITPVWTPIEYTINYEENGGTQQESRNIDVDAIFTSSHLPNNAECRKVGYKLLGWCLLSDLSSSSMVNDKRFCTVTENGKFASVGTAIDHTNKTITLYAKWEAVSYSIHYYTNDSGSPTSSDAITYDSNFTSELLFEPIKTGFVFDGWFTTSDFSGNALTTSSVFNITHTFTKIEHTSPAYFNLYAKFSIGTFYVNFNGNGGITALDRTSYTQDIVFNESEELMANEFARTAYTFANWNTKADGTGTTYVNNASFTMNVEGITLYAQWTARNYNVTFNGNGNTSGEMNSQSIAYNTQANLNINEFVKTGYLFTGWNTKSDGTGTTYANNASFTMSVEGITLYAQWTENSFNVVFDSNNGNGEMVPQGIVFGQSENLNANTFTKEFYEFAGWTTNPNGSGLSYVDGANYTMTTEGITLYAKWTPSNYNLTFNANFGENPNTTTQQLTYNIAENLDGNTFERVGYKFSSWNTQANGEGTIYANLASYTMTIAGATLYAQWMAKPYDVTFNANYGENPTTKTQEIDFDANMKLKVNTFVRTGYSFAGWNTKADGTGIAYADNVSFTMNVEGITLYAQWTLNQYSIVFNANTGEGIMANQEVTYYDSENLISNTFTKTGHTFAGWNTKVDGTGTAYANNASFTMNVLGQTLYAQWTIAAFSITFDGNGSTSGDMAEITNITFNTSTTITANTFVKDHYVFAGWSLESNSNVVYADEDSITMSTEGITLYAQWTLEKYNVQFQFDGNVFFTFENIEYGTVYNESTAYNASVFNDIYEANAPIGKEGGNFYLSTDTLKTVIYTLESTVADFGANGTTVTFLIDWKTIQREIILNYDGATGGNTITSIIRNYGDSLGTLPTPTKTDYTFIGWYSSNTEFSANTLVSSTITWTNEFTTLYAIFISNTETFSIELDKNGGNIDYLEATISYTILTGEQIIKPANKTGYNFTGWKLKADAIIGGIKILEGTVLPGNIIGTILNTTISANSWGLISMIAQFEAKINTITFYKSDGEGGWTQVGTTLEGAYLTNVEDLSGYNYETYMGSMTKYSSDLIFDGWYTSNTVFDSTTKFTGIVGSSNIVLYPNYIARLSAPTNIFMASDGTVLSWNTVEGATHYEIIVDNGTPVIATTNSYETAFLLANAGTYSIEIRAMSTYEGQLTIPSTPYKENINSVQTDYIFVRTTSLSSTPLLKITENNETRFVFFTGLTYIWNSADYQLEILNASNLNVASLNVTTSLNSGVIVYRSELVVNSMEVGTFDLKINYINQSTTDLIRNVKVIQDVDTFTNGDSYSQYSSAVQPTSTQYLDKENPVEYQIGTGSGFDFDFALKKTGLAWTNIDLSDEDLMSYSFEVYENDAYRNATTSELPTRLVQENLVAGDLQTVGMFKFASENAGKKYKVTMTWNYSRNGVNSTENPTGKMTHSMVFTLNEGVNAQTSDQLKKYYGDKNIHLVNVLRNIKATLSVEQSQADGSPINVQSSRVFDNDDLISDNKTIGDTRKTDGNIYKRAYGNLTNDEIVVNGNYMNIDASDVPLVGVEYSNGYSDSGESGVHRQTGLQTTASNGYILLRPNTGIFRYQVPKGGKAYFNNLTIISNKPSETLTEINYNTIYPEATSYTDACGIRVTQESSSLTAIYAETSYIVTNNIIIRDVHQGIRMDGVFKYLADDADPTKGYINNGVVEANYTEIYNSYCNAIYSWQGKAVGAYHSYFHNLNGPAIQIDNENSNTQPIVAIDKHTIISNYLTGTESWFTLWGLTALVGQLQAQLTPSLQASGNSVTLSVQNNTRTGINYIFIYRGSKGVDPGYVHDGTLASHLAHSGEVYMYIGGEKSYLTEEKTYTNKGLPITDGTMTRRTYESRTDATDPRFISAVGGYIFALTPFATKTEFNNFSLGMSNILGNSTLSGLAIAYTLVDTEADKDVLWENIKGQPCYYNETAVGTVEQLMCGGNLNINAREMFAKLAYNFVKYYVFASAMTSAGNDIMNGYLSYLDSNPGYANSVYNQVIQEIETNLAFLDTFLAEFRENSTDNLNSEIKSLFTESLFKEFCEINASPYGKLLSYAAFNNDANIFGQFLMFKMAETTMEDSQFIELAMSESAEGEAQILLFELNYLDKIGWYQEMEED